jgi:DNA (cytosine-5)-methyltransferase 1
LTMLTYFQELRKTQFRRVIIHPIRGGDALCQDTLTHIDLFSGIGGFALACKWNGIKTVQFVEIDKFCQKVLNKNFPGVPIHDDIKTFKYTGARPFILTGGVPCQPVSHAGKRRGTEDDRWLWGESFRVFFESKAEWGIFENVVGLLTIEHGLVFSKLLLNLENKGYSTQTYIIPACAVGAPHRRDRVWIVANANSDGMERRWDGNNAKINRQGWTCCKEDMFHQKIFTRGYSGESESELIRADDGVPHWMDRVKSLGNSIVPQVANEIMKAILAVEINEQKINKEV